MLCKEEHKNWGDRGYAFCPYCGESVRGEALQVKAQGAVGQRSPLEAALGHPLEEGQLATKEEGR